MHVIINPWQPLDLNHVVMNELVWDLLALLLSNDMIAVMEFTPRQSLPGSYTCKARLSNQDNDQFVLFPRDPQTELIFFGAWSCSVFIEA